MIWLILVVYAYRWTRSLGSSEVEEWEGRIDFWAKFLLLTGLVLLVALVVSGVFLAFADAAYASAVAGGDASGAAFWGTMKSWLVGVVVVVALL